MKTFRQFLGEEVVKAIHRTTPAAAQAIRQNGFSLEHFGHGAGLGMVEEPAGIFVSVGREEDFAKEVEDRGLGMTEIIHIEFPVSKVWRPTSQERIAAAKQYEIEFIIGRYGLGREDAEALRRGSIRVIRDHHLDDVWRDWVSILTEIEFKKFFSQKLLDQGYSAVEWREPVRGVHQMLVLDPTTIKIVG